MPVGVHQEGLQTLGPRFGVGMARDDGVDFLQQIVGQFPPDHHFGPEVERRG